MTASHTDFGRFNMQLYYQHLYTGSDLQTFVTSSFLTTRIPSGIWSRLYGCASRAESVSCNTAVKWHAHIFKWHSAGWPRASTADCDWSAIGPLSQEKNCHGQKRDYLSRVSQRARGARLKIQVLSRLLM